jgi:hypothetical protein
MENYGNKNTVKDLCKKYHISIPTIHNILKENNIAIRSYATYILKNVNCLKNIDDEYKAYFLGLMYSDGCLHKNIARITLVGKEDSSVLEKLNNYFYINKPNLQFNKKQNSYSFSIIHKNIAECLIQHGCFRKKSLILKFPPNNSSPYELFHHFLRGYFDGDGSISINKKSKNARFRLCGTLEFLTGVKEYIEKKLKLPCYIMASKMIYELCISDRTGIQDIQKYIYKDSTISLDRKRIGFNDAVEIVSSNKHSSKYRGICHRIFNTCDRWFAHITINGKQIGLGNFLTEKEAIKARKQAELKYLGKTYIL